MARDTAITPILPTTKGKEAMADQHTDARSLNIENLEDRRLMAASIQLYGSTLVIEGTSGNDYAYVREANGGLQAVMTPSGDTTQQINETFALNSVTKIIMRGHDGNDTLLNYNTNIRSEIYGGNGNDYLYGGNSNDTLFGLNGNDTIKGNGGNDYIHGDNDYFPYLGGDDRIYGGNGNDTIAGDGGDDTIYGESGNDVLFGDNDHDWSYATTNGVAGDDVLDGGSGNDRLDGDGGNDTLTGGAGNDSLFGLDGVDYLYGQSGNDYLDGGDDGVTDVLFGGSGQDRFVSNGKWQFSYGSYRWVSDSIRDYSAFDDTIIGAGFTFSGSPYTINW